MAMSLEDRRTLDNYIASVSGGKKPDMIDHPPHYTATKVEPIDVIEAWKLGFHLGNCLKYIARCDLKGRPLEDLRKARWYLDREIARREGASESA